MNVLFAAGGTAGHINPALAIADKLTAAFPTTNVLFVGNPNGMEKKLVRKAGYDFVGVEMHGFERGFSPKEIAHNFKAAYCYFFSAKRSVKRIIKEFKPDLAVGTGGYVRNSPLADGVNGHKDSHSREQFLPRSSDKNAFGQSGQGISSV